MVVEIESIRIEKDRINISELDDMCSDPALASGGYLVELDNYDEDGQIVLEEQSCAGSDHYIDALRITPDTPEEYSEPLSAGAVAPVRFPDLWLRNRPAIGSRSGRASIRHL